jgi:hypothetical protein
MVVEITFAFLVGLTIGGMTASAMEIATGRPVSFRAGYISAERPARTVLASVAAGPMMLTNDALDARRGGRISPALLAFCGFAALAWTTAVGTAVVGLAAHTVASLS